MMMRNALVLLALCTFSAAMVPRNRRALDIHTESAIEDIMSRMNKEASNTNKTICAPHTPCSWEIYKSSSKIVDVSIENTYCKCGKGTTCQEDELDTAMNYRVFKCKPEINDEKTVES